MPRTQTKDEAADLAEKMLRVLESQRSSGADSYPLTVKQLAQSARQDASPALIAKVLAKRTFQNQVVLPRTKDFEAPIALERDTELLAASPLALEFLLRAARTASNRAFSVAQLTGKASSKFKKP